MQTLLTVMAIFAGLVVAAFGLGRTRGKSTAEAKAAAERATAQAKESEKHVEVLKNAVDTQQDINRLPDAGVSERLRQHWRREGD